MPFIYITEEVEKRAKKYALQSRLERLCSKLESASVDEIVPVIMERMYPLYKEREGNFRIMGQLVHVNIAEDRIPVMVLWQIFVRGDKEYERLSNISPEKRSEYVEKYLPSEEELRAFVQDRLSQDRRPQPAKRPLPPELANWLTPFEKSQGETMIFESQEWVKHTEEAAFKQKAHRYCDLLKESVHGNRMEVLQEPLYRFRDEHGVIYALRLLVDIRDHPAEEIVFLIDFRDRVDPALEETLLQSLRGDEDEATKSKASYSWLAKFAEGIVDRPEKLDLLSQHTGRAYYAYFLADEIIWRAIEGVEFPGTTEAGLDRRNPALSVEEIQILNQARHGSGSEKAVLPLFINGRAGSGKSTMLHYLFTDYLVRKAKENLPGEIVFLTYTERLRDDAKRTVKELLRVGSQFAAETLDDLALSNLLEQSFWVFPEFLRQFLTEEERIQRFSNEQFIAGFGDFQRLYDQMFPKGLQKYSPDAAWHIIRTYIKGYRTDDYLSPEEYADLPAKERSVPEEMYKWVWEKVWPRYQQEGYWDTQDLVRYLIENDRVPACYAVIFCDEAQDFTRVEMQFLWRLLVYRKYDLSKQGYHLRIPLVLAGDPFQTLNPTGFRWEALKAGFYDEVIGSLDPEGYGLVELAFEELHYNYRSTAPIVHFGNLLQYWRKRFFETSGEIWQTHWRQDQHILPPRLYILGRTVTEDMLLQKMQGEAIILPCEYNQEEQFIAKEPLLQQLRQASNPPSLLSAMEAKGLEFKRVWLYKFGEYCPDNFFSSEKFQNYDLRLRNEFFLNKLYVAATRAEQDLIIIDTEKGEQRLWRYALTPQLLTETLPAEVGGVTSGDPYPLDRVLEDQIDPLTMAEQLAKANTPKLLRQASDYYRRAGKSRQARFCEARALELERRYKEAGEVYRELSGEYLTHAERCFWNAQAWDELEHLYTILSPDGSNPFYRRASQVMRARYTPHKVSYGDIQTFIEDLVNSSESQLEHKSTQVALQQAVDLLLERAQQEGYEVLLLTLASHLVQKSAYVAIIGEEKSAWLCYHAGKYQEAIDFWNASGTTKPQEYFLAQANIASDDNDKILWLAEARNHEKIVRIWEELHDNPERVRALNEESRKAIGQALLLRRRYQDALEWYQKNGLLHDAFGVLEKHWSEIPQRPLSLQNFFDEVLRYIEQSPTDSNIEFTETVIRFIQSRLAERDGARFIQDYWERLGSLGRWERVLDSQKKTKGDYRRRSPIYIARLVAASSEILHGDIRHKQRLAEFLLEHFSPQASKVWLSEVPLSVLAAAIEKVGRDLDALKWYEELESLESLSPPERQFVRRRWLKVKQRRLSHITDRDRISRERQEIEAKMQAWGILPSVIEKEPEYPNEKASREIHVESKWDGKACLLSDPEHNSVFISVTDGVIGGVGIEIQQEKKQDSIVFDIPSWGIGGHLYPGSKVELFIDDQPWLTFVLQE